MSLKNLVNSWLRNSNLILLLILFVGFSLRVINPTIGFPILYISGDEASYYLSALNMLANKTVFTIGNYGPLGAYVQIPFLVLAFLTLRVSGEVSSFADIEKLLVTQEGYFLFIPRLISALFGTLTILASYHLARLLFGSRKIALMTALLSAFSLNFVYISHQARAMAPTIFFSIVAVYFGVFALKNKDFYVKFMSFASISAAVSFGFHQFGGLIIILLFLITLTAGYRLREYLNKTFLPFVYFFILVFIFNYLSLGIKFISILNPYNLNDSVTLVQQNVISYHSFDYIFKFAKRLFLSDPIIVLSVLFFTFWGWNKKSIYRAFSIFFLINLFLVLFVFPAFLRYFLIAFAFFPLVASPILVRLISRFKNKIIIIAFLSLLISFNAIYFNLLISHKGTFSQSREWLNTNVPVDKVIVSTSHRNVGYTPIEMATYKIREIKPNYYSKAKSLINNQYLPNMRFIVYANELSDGKMSKIDYTKLALKYYDTDYIIDTYFQENERLLNSLNSDPKFKLIKHFSPTADKIYDSQIPEAFSDAGFLFPLFSIKRPGPYIDIVRVE